ncbi:MULTISPECIES: DNA cytosine methyltransferase [unclassified Methylophilus]|uniref:DNA cytosine methyltransferase n=1 Tax=unclassified Methylophilus TaxID=2630143 RepID=UPI0003A0DB82|nr:MULTISPECIES: DNA cytosine methyltransferase [unclassified Methylophilus]
MKFIELFAGCGGLSLGLKSVGFDLVMANELSPMASESYALNFLGEDLQEKSLQDEPDLSKTLWLSSQYPVTKLKSRLRENPFTYPSIKNGHSDIKVDGSNLNGSLVVGSIVELNKWLDENPASADLLKSGFDGNGVDLVSGGPPCQSFSMAGLRKLDCEKNSLPWEFAKFAKTINPKIVVLENVTGILRPFKDENGKEYYAWFELAKAFSAIGYIPLCLHVNAKLAGVPQNRPRFILLGVREDFYIKLSSTFNDHEVELFEQPFSFYMATIQNEDVDYSSLKYRDVSKLSDLKLFQNSFLSPLVAFSENLVSVQEAIGDLSEDTTANSEFALSTYNIFKNTLPRRLMKNHDLRRNNDLVRRRFRIYQVMQLVSRKANRAVASILKGEQSTLDSSDWNELSQYDYLNENGKRVKFKSKTDFIEFLKKHPTKKQTQKALLKSLPAPAALSIPDDACHYEELRTLTVREMARIQSFPDNFEFRSKITTGGKMRSFEVPQYTQVGNAVPPLLGRALGLVVEDLLKRNVDRKSNSAEDTSGPIYAVA